MARKHNLDEVLRSFRTKNDVRINGKDILVLTNMEYNPKTGKTEFNRNKKFDLGNGSWGKIDYLVNYCGYHKYEVSCF